MVTTDFSPEVELLPVRARAMHPAIIVGTVRSLWTCMAMGQIPRSTERISSCSNFGHCVFEPPFGEGVRDNVRCSSLGHWKARSGLPISDN